MFHCSGQRPLGDASQDTRCWTLAIAMADGLSATLFCSCHNDSIRPSSANGQLRTSHAALF